MLLVSGNNGIATLVAPGRLASVVWPTWMRWPAREAEVRLVAGYSRMPT